MSVNEATMKEQLPQGVQKSGDAKLAVGVIDEGLYTQGDVLKNQALMMARARQGIAVEDGAQFTEEFTQQFRRYNTPKQFVHQRLSEETINQIQQGTQQRDQQYIGNNADWTGYYLEPLAKFIVPCHGAAC
jgi:hypothetical protein